MRGVERGQRGDLRAPAAPGVVSEQEHADDADDGQGKHADYRERDPVSHGADHTAIYGHI